MKEARDEHDFYPTHPIATKALLTLEPFDGLIWEPTAGQGHAVKAIHDFGLEVIGTDLVEYEDRLDFVLSGVDFTTERSLAVARGMQCKNIICLPPFKKHLFDPMFENMLQFCSESGGKLALFYLTTLFHADKRIKLMKKYGYPSRVYTFAPRVPMAEGVNTGAQDYSWYVWSHVPSNEFSSRIEGINYHDFE
jgi:hypothetical protein